MTALMRVGQIEHNSLIYGPYSRTVVWTKGCDLACKGCWNKDLWPSVGGEIIEVKSIVDKAIDSGDEGITILGGEPLQQASSTLALIMNAQQRVWGISIHWL